MFVVNGYLFFGYYVCGQLVLEVEEVLDDWMQVYIVMCLVVVVVDCYCEDGELGDDQYVDQYVNLGYVGQICGQEVEYGVQYCGYIFKQLKGSLVQGFCIYQYGLGVYVDSVMYLK